MARGIKPKKADYKKTVKTANAKKKAQAKALADAKEIAKGTGMRGKGMVKTKGRTVKSASKSAPTPGPKRTVKTNNKLAKKVTAPRKAKEVAATTGTKSSRTKIAVNRKLNNLTGSKTSTLAKRKAAERKIASAKKTATAAKKSAVSATKTGIKMAKKSTKTGIKMAKTGAGKAKMQKSSLMMKANNLYNKKTGSNTSALKKKAMVKNRIGKAVGNASSSMSSWSSKKKLAMQKLWNRNKK